MQPVDGLTLSGIGDAQEEPLVIVGQRHCLIEQRGPVLGIDTGLDTGLSLAPNSLKILAALLKKLPVLLPYQVLVGRREQIAQIPSVARRMVRGMARAVNPNETRLPLTEMLLVWFMAQSPWLLSILLIG